MTVYGLLVLQWENWFYAEKLFIFFQKITVSNSIFRVNSADNELHQSSSYGIYFGLGSKYLYTKCTNRQKKYIKVCFKSMLEI